LNNLANVYLKKKEYDKAEVLYSEAKSILEKVLGKEHPSYASCLNNLASIYWVKRELDKVEQLFMESNSIFEKILGKVHPDYAKSLNNLARLYREEGQIKQSEQYFTEASSSFTLILQKSATYLTSLELEKQIALYKDENDVFFSFNHQTTSDSFRIESFNNALFYKGFALETAIHLENTMQTAPDSIHALYSRWKGYNRLLAAELAKPITERKDAARLDSSSNALEKTLLRAAPAFAEARRQVQWSDVRDALRPGEAAIEFIRYRYSGKITTDSTLYSALVLLPGETAPHFIPLCEERQFDALIPKPNGPRANYIQNLYASIQPGGQPSLYQLIWQPIEQVLQGKGIQTVYYSPSGLLHRLNLAAIAPNKSGRTISDRYRLIQLGSTRQLTDRVSPSTLPKSALIYGGIRYDMDSTSIAKANQDLAATAQDTTGGLFRYALRGENRGDSAQYLPGTEKEARFLYNLLQKQGVSATLRLGYYGTEESIKQIGLNGPSPDLLHIGTHGFFFPDPKSTTGHQAMLGQDAPVFKVSDYPLIRSGLKLAGSDYAWKTKHPMPGMEDGILTAQEVSQMNLSNTKLVVLSACETGLGDIKGNEGVYGLQRAFRIAGAKNVLMSLWKVPDEATMQLMTRFYNNWLEQKMPLREAFESAQQWLRGQKGFENPYFWAGFVLVGE
jgi:CHAT domain-containing protein/tetratricopeptide (TPR) repeat protein